MDTQKSTKTCNRHLWTKSEKKSKQAMLEQKGPCKTYDHADQTRFPNRQSALQEERLEVQVEVEAAAL
jgi:hypothetical protein